MRLPVPFVAITLLNGSPPLALQFHESWAKPPELSVAFTYWPIKKCLRLLGPMPTVRSTLTG